MLKWLLTLFIALVVLSLAMPWLARLGVGRLPGDVRFRLGGHDISIPFASTLALSLLVWGISRLI